MATPSQLLDAWTACNMGRRHCYRPQESCLQEFEYQGPPMGHPLNYAAVRFQCDPLDELAIAVGASWPTNLARPDWADLERAIAEAIIDALMSQFAPYSGCRLTLVEVGWPHIASSEAAFYRATVEPMRRLMPRGKWALTDGIPNG